MTSVTINKISHKGNVVGYRIKSLGLPSCDVSVGLLEYFLESIRGKDLYKGVTLRAFVKDGVLITEDETNVIGVDSKSEINAFIRDYYNITEKSEIVGVNNFLIERLYICLNNLSTVDSIQLGVIKSVEVSSKMTSTLGLCHTRDRETFNITIAERLLVNGDINQIDSTIVHELLHTCKGAFDHGCIWLGLAEIVNYFFGYNVTRLGKSITSELSVDELQSQGYYVCVCVGCGHIAPRKSKSNFIKYPGMYKCRLCGGIFKRVC